MIIDNMIDTGKALPEHRENLITILDNELYKCSLRVVRQIATDTIQLTILNKMGAMRDGYSTCSK